MKIMVQTVIFSYDRPAQLEVLLKSVRKFDRQNLLKLNVLYSFSTDEFAKGYDIVKENFKEVLFVEEKRLLKPKFQKLISKEFIFNALIWIRNSRYRKRKSDFKELLIQLVDKNLKYIMFLTDDSLFYHDIDIKEDVLSRVSESRGSAFSLAHGKNIDGSIYTEEDNYIKWSVSRNKKDLKYWDYPFSVDGRIYQKKHVLPIFEDLLYSNPNTFETIVVASHFWSNKFTNIYANNQSSLVGFELNIVQDVFANLNRGVDHKYINKLFLDGYRMLISFDEQGVHTFRPESFSVKMIDKGSEIELYNC